MTRKVEREIAMAERGKHHFRPIRKMARSVCDTINIAVEKRPPAHQNGQCDRAFVLRAASRYGARLTEHTKVEVPNFWYEFVNFVAGILRQTTGYDPTWDLV